jgi:pimeloyl-ACP methyl ester carboxylesterase
VPSRRSLARRGEAWLALAAAQARLPLGLAAAHDGRLLGAPARWLGGAIKGAEIDAGGTPATLYRPGRGRGPWPCVVVLPGITRRGRAHPAFPAIGRCLAATGQLAIVAEPEGLAVGELTPATLEQARSAVQWAASSPDARGDGVTLVGVSGGATLALLVAADEPVRRVTALAPCCDIREALRMVTTGVYGDALFESGDFFKLVIARSLVAWLPPGDDRSALREHVLGLEDYGPDPLAAVRAWPRAELGDNARALVELLANEDPARFDGLYEALSAELQANAELLSPLTVAARTRAAVEVVAPRRDKYLPLADSIAFTDACPLARLTVLGSISHVVPTLSPRDVRGLAQLDAVLVRLLAGARAPSYSRS